MGRIQTDEYLSNLKVVLDFTEDGPSFDDKQADAVVVAQVNIMVSSSIMCC